LQTHSGNADLSARIEGFIATREWHGETYLKVDRLDVADLLAHYLPTHYGLHGMQLSLESWGEWRDAAPVASHGNFDLYDLRLHPKDPDAVPLHLVLARAGFTMQRGARDFEVGLKDLVLGFRGHQWPFGDLALAVSEEPEGDRHISAAADYLRIDDVARILQVRWPRKELREPIEALQPRGEVRDLRFRAAISAEHTEWQLMGKFSGLTTAPWGEIPGLENLEGRLHGQQDRLAVRLDSHDARVRFRDLFRDPIELVDLEGRLDVLHEDGRWRLRSEQLIANTPHIDTRTRVALDYRPDRPLFLDLQTDFSEGDAAHALRYYPTGIMDEDVVAWLDASIRSGRVPGGTALVHGPLDAFPYEETPSGVFQVVFDTRDLELDYLEGWPTLEHLDAHVRFHGNQLDIELDSASIYDSRVTETSAHMASLNPASPLQVNGRVTGPLRDILRLLQDDALRDDFGDVVAPMRAKGDSELRMAFTIPLEDEVGYALDGQLHLGGAEMSLPDWGFTISDIRGRLDFDLEGLSANGIRAYTLGSPVTVDVSAREDGTTRLRTRGRLDIRDIDRQLPTIPLRAADGAADFTIDLDIPPTGAPKDAPGILAVESDLKGVRVGLPRPFGKQADEGGPLAVSLPIGGQRAAGHLSYAGQIDARFTSDGDTVDVVLGGGKARLGSTAGIRIVGKPGTVDLLEWGDALNSLPDMEGGGPDSLEVDLQFERLQADNLGIDDLRLNAGLQSGLWQGEVEAPNLVGTFSAARELTHRPIQVDLERLNLSAALGDQDFEVVPTPDPHNGPDPTTMPGLVLNIAELRINDAELGQLRLNAQRSPAGLQLTQFNLTGGQLELQSAGHWSRIGPRYETEWGGSIHTGNLGDLLVDLGYSRQVELAPSELEFLLRWPGNPAQLHRATLDGRIGLDVGAGRIVELDPGVTRVVGLLNLNALTRRLRLDFSDIYKKGYSFDSLRGDFHFADGTARTDNLRVNGPSGRIDLNGSADLVGETLDQHVTVTPQYDATLPIAGTLAGGPVAGLAVLVVQKAMTKQVDNLNRFEYSLSGPWDQPEVHQLDSGGTLSRILQPLTGDNPAAQPPDNGLSAAPAPRLEAHSDAAPRTAPPDVDEKTAAPGAPETGTDDVPATGENPLRGLINILRKSESHGGDLPGEGG